jgi:hypothetical protein
LDIVEIPTVVLLCLFQGLVAAYASTDSLTMGFAVCLSTIKYTGRQNLHIKRGRKEKGVFGPGPAMNKTNIVKKTKY